MPGYGSTTARSGGGVYVEGLSDLLAGFRRLGRPDAVDTFRDEIYAVVGAAILPEVRSRTPVGETGKLRAASRVTLYRATQVALENTLPYANPVHWGRLWWPNEHGGAKRRQRVASRMARTEFMYGPLYERADELQQVVADAIESALLKTVG